MKRIYHLLLLAAATSVLFSCGDDKTPEKSGITTPERPSEIRIGDRRISIGYAVVNETKWQVDSIAIADGEKTVWAVKLHWLPDSMVMTGLHNGEPATLSFRLSSKHSASSVIEYGGTARAPLSETVFYYDPSGFISNIKTTYYRSSGNNSFSGDRYVKFEVDNNSINRIIDNATTDTEITYSRMDDSAHISVAMSMWDSDAYLLALYANVLGRASGKLPTRVVTLRDADKSLISSDTIDSYEYSPEGNLLRCRIRPLEGGDSATVQVSVKYQH